MRQKLAVLLIALALVSPVPAEAGFLRGCLSLWGSLVSWVDKIKVRFGVCNECRAAGDYVLDFGPALVEELGRLGPDEAVLELGSGQTLFGRQLFLGEPITGGVGSAATDYTDIGLRGDLVVPTFTYYRPTAETREAMHAFAQRADRDKPRFVAVTRNPVGVALKESEKFELLTGDYDNPRDELHRKIPDGVGAVIDQFGIFSYTSDPDHLLRDVFGKLKVGGSLFLNHSASHLRIYYRGTLYSAADFFKQVKGLDVREISVEVEKSSDPQFRDPRGISHTTLAGGLQILKTGPVQLPKLTSGPGVPLHDGVSARSWIATDPN